MSTTETPFDINNIWRDLPPGTPFRNAIAKFREIFRAQLLKEPARTTALHAIKPYKGRGKNHNYPFIKRLESRQPKPSKYKPHHSAREGWPVFQHGLTRVNL